MRLAQKRLNFVGDEEGFVLAVGRFVVADERAALALGPELFAFAANVVGDDRAGGFKNDLRGAVVLLEADDAGVGKIFFELENVANVGAAPGIDALILVADGADVLVLAGQQLHQLVLRTVGVLVLVDQYILIAALVALAHFAGDFEQARGFEQQVVEVHGVVLEQFDLVGLEDVGDALAGGILRAEEVILRIDHVIFGPGDAAEHGARGELLGVKPHALHDLLDDALLIVFVEDGE